MLKIYAKKDSSNNLIKNNKINTSWNAYLFGCSPNKYDFACSDAYVAACLCNALQFAFILLMQTFDKSGPKCLSSNTSSNTTILDKLPFACSNLRFHVCYF